MRTFGRTGRRREGDATGVANFLCTAVHSCCRVGDCLHLLWYVQMWPKLFFGFWGVLIVSDWHKVKIARLLSLSEVWYNMYLITFPCSAELSCRDEHHRCRRFVILKLLISWIQSPVWEFFSAYEVQSFRFDMYPTAGRARSNGKYGRNLCWTLWVLIDLTPPLDKRWCLQCDGKSLLTMFLCRISYICTGCTKASDTFVGFCGVAREILRKTFSNDLVVVAGWYVAVKLVLVHIPLVQEICGLRKKPPIVRPTPRFTHVHSNTTQSILARWTLAPIICSFSSFL